MNPLRVSRALTHTGTPHLCSSRQQNIALASGPQREFDVSANPVKALTSFFAYRVARHPVELSAPILRPIAVERM